MNWTVAALTEFVQRLMSKGNPLKPSFLVENTVAQNNVTGDGTTYTVQFATTLFDQHGDFDGTSTFTTPATGVYLFTFNVVMENLNGTSNLANLVTSNKSYLLHRENGTEAAIAGYTMTGSIICDMDEGDTATVTVNEGGGSKTTDVSNGASHFSGALIS